MYSVTMAIVNDKTNKEEVVSIKVKDEDMRQFKKVTTMSFGVGDPVIGKTKERNK